MGKVSLSMSPLHTCEPRSTPSSLLLTLPHLAKESLGLRWPRPPVLCALYTEHRHLYLLITLTISCGTLARWHLQLRLSRAQAEGEIPNTQGWRGRFQTEDCTVNKGLSQTVVLSQVRRARSSGKVPSQGEHGSANLVSGFACADGVAGFTFTALVLIPLPTVLPVWTLLCNCGHCLKRRAAELGAQESV